MRKFLRKRLISPSSLLNMHPLSAILYTITKNHHFPNLRPKISVNTIRHCYWRRQCYYESLKFVTVCHQICFSQPQLVTHSTMHCTYRCKVKTPYSLVHRYSFVSALPVRLFDHLKNALSACLAMLLRYSTITLQSKRQ